MKKSLLGILLVLALVVAMAPVVWANNLEVYDLIAGNPKNGVNKVGEVQVSNDGTNLFVKYFIIDQTPADLTDNYWGISEVHVAVSTTYLGLPQTKMGNPIPGAFPYQINYDPAVKEAKVVIPFADIPGYTSGMQLYVAAHGVVVGMAGLEAFEANLPATVEMHVHYPFTGAPSYFQLHVTTDGYLKGEYDSWCVDTDHTIGNGTPYTANVYSSYEDAAAGFVEHPENLDLVNWILNQNFVGQTSPGGLGIYTYGDVQRAIWELVEDTPSTSGLGPWTQAKVNEIKAAAQNPLTGGEGFVPGCNQIVAVVLVPVNGTQVIIGQAVMLEFSVPCVALGNETVWTGTPNSSTAGGYDWPFLGKNWGLYFLYPKPIL